MAHFKKQTPLQTDGKKQTETDGEGVDRRVFRYPRSSGLSRRIKTKRLVGFSRDPSPPTDEQTGWEKERQELRQENADLTEKINQLEVCVGQLLKEVRYLTTECARRVAENEKLRQEVMQPSA